MHTYITCTTLDIKHYIKHVWCHVWCPTTTSFYFTTPLVWNWMNLKSSSAKSEIKVRQRVTCRVVLCVVFVHNTNKVLFAYLNT